MNDLHIHMVLDGSDFRAAIAMHKAAPNEAWIRAQLRKYQQKGVTFLRDGGDAWGVSLFAKAIAPEYGIDYRSPAFPIHKKGCYGSFIGRGWSDLDEYRSLLQEAKASGADFIKIMISGLMDFSCFGKLTQPTPTAEEIRILIDMAHDMGFAVMAHCNGIEPTLAAAKAKVDSIEHGAYLNEEAICAMLDNQVIWVPTLSTIGNLIGNGRFPDEVLQKILDSAMKNLHLANKKGVLIGCGSDAGAYCVYHAMQSEEEYLQRIVPSEVLKTAEIQSKQEFIYC